MCLTQPRAAGLVTVATSWRSTGQPPPAAPLRASWPLAFVSDRYHPRRDDLPALTGNARALAQSTWRHLLFGVVFGELERRLNRPEEDLPPAYEAYVSPNGHGSIEHAAAAGAAGEA